ncbi:MAG: amidohydrolase [Bacteroidales bacterium]
MKEIIALRHLLHSHPELSNQEAETSATIERFMAPLKPDRVIRVGSHGRIFVFEGTGSGSTTLFRAELDALPIKENSGKDYASRNPGISHACGHDGHMSMLAGLAVRIASSRPVRGKVGLLFQPAEEVEQGAREVVNDPRFSEIEPDAIFALHNIPGVPLHHLVIRPGSFASASKGMVIRLQGRSSHAGEPEKGINPAVAMSDIVLKVNKLNREQGLFEATAFATVIHLRLGEVAHGTSPGEGEVRLTLRSFEDRDMEILTSRVEKLVREIAQKEQLQFSFSTTEVFPATVNDPACISMMEKAARQQKIPMTMLDDPFRWSEDFGYYTERFPGGYAGLGSGETQPPLHHPGFDFPDDLLDTGIRYFYALYVMNHL